MPKKLTTKEFILRAKEVHGNKYDYSKATDYQGYRYEVTIVCPRHGGFKPTGNSHIYDKSGCPDCGRKSGSKKRTNTIEEILARAKEVHGNKYDYSKSIYDKYHNNMIITCTKHGDFNQTPANHLNGAGCKDCAKELSSNKQKYSTQDFIKKAKKKFGSKYDYSKVTYIDSYTKVKIICRKHGEFEQLPTTHLRKSTTYGCSDCAHEQIAKKQSLMRKDFLIRAKKIHGDKYDYSEVKFKKSNEITTIICKIHGKFPQSPKLHLRGHGCEDCGGSKQLTQEDFLRLSDLVHGDKYDYSKANYININSDLLIICKSHGEFTQRARKHLMGRGCTKCKNKSEGKIAIYLNEKFVVHRNYRIKDRLFDFYLPDYDLIIERDGEQHYFDVNFFSKGEPEYLEKQQSNDKYKTKLAEQRGFKVRRIPFWLNDEQVEKEIDNILKDKPTYPSVPDLNDFLIRKLPN